MIKLEWHNEKRKLKDLIPFEFNPRKLSTKEHQDLGKSLLKFNLAELPVINLDNKICAGHQRILILAELYGTDYEIEVRVPNRDLTPEEFKEYNIRSNKNAGSWDFDILANHFELNDLHEWGFNEHELFGIGFDLGDNGKFDYQREYEGMPEFQQDDVSGIKILVHFDSQEDVKNFAKLIGQSLTDKTRSIWFPYKEREHYDKQS